MVKHRKGDPRSEPVIQDKDGEWRPVSDWLALGLVFVGVMPWTVIIVGIVAWWGM